MSQNLPEPTPLPQCCERTILLLISIILRADVNQIFSISWLSEYGISQTSQAMVWLRFMNLLNESQQLCGDVLRARHNLQTLQDLLRIRLESTSEGAQLPISILKLIGNKNTSWDDIKNTLKECDQIKQISSPFIRSNTVGAFRGTDQVLRHLSKEGWLEGKISGIRSKGGGSNREPSQAGSPAKKSILPVYYGFDEGGHLLVAEVHIPSGKMTLPVIKAIGEYLLRIAQLPEI